MERCIELTSFLFLFPFFPIFPSFFPSSSGAVLPHVVFPLWRAANRFVVTPKGEDPPPLGQHDSGSGGQFPNSVARGEREAWLLSEEEGGRFDTDATYVGRWDERG